MRNTHLVTQSGTRTRMLAATLTAAVAVAFLLATTPALAIPTCTEPEPPPTCQDPTPPPPGPPPPPPCQLYVEQPTDTWYFPGQLDPNIITGGGGRDTGACGSEDSTVTVRLRQDRPWQPDRTLAEKTSSDGFVNLQVTYVCDDDDEMKIFTETLTSDGDKVQSPRLYTYCG